MSCQFTVNARLISWDGSTELFAMEDHAAGFELANDIVDPEWDEVQQRVTAVYMNGSAPASVPTIGDGTLPVTVRVRGSSWVEVRQRVAALRAAWRAEDRFYLEVVTEGVTTTYVAERLAWQPERIQPWMLAAFQQEVTLVFRVQPNPTEVYA